MSSTVVYLALLPLVTAWPMPSTVVPSKRLVFERCLETDLSQIEDLKYQLSEAMQDISEENINLISFGLLEEDWRRLYLLQSKVPKGSVLESKLVSAFRILIAALYQAHKIPTNDENEPDHVEPEEADYNVESDVEESNTKHDDGLGFNEQEQSEETTPYDYLGMLYNGINDWSFGDLFKDTDEVGEESVIKESIVSFDSGSQESTDNYLNSYQTANPNEVIEEAPKENMSGSGKTDKDSSEIIEDLEKEVSLNMLTTETYRSSDQLTDLRKVSNQVETSDNVELNSILENTYNNNQYDEEIISSNEAAHELNPEDKQSLPLSEIQADQESTHHVLSSENENSTTIEPTKVPKKSAETCSEHEKCGSFNRVSENVEVSEEEVSIGRAFESAQNIANIESIPSTYELNNSTDTKLERTTIENGEQVLEGEETNNIPVIFAAELPESSEETHSNTFVKHPSLGGFFREEIFNSKENSFEEVSSKATQHSSSKEYSRSSKEVSILNSYQTSKSNEVFHSKFSELSSDENDTTTTNYSVLNTGENLEGRNKTVYVNSEERTFSSFENTTEQNNVQIFKNSTEQTALTHQNISLDTNKSNFNNLPIEDKNISLSGEGTTISANNVNAHFVTSIYDLEPDKSDFQESTILPKDDDNVISQSVIELPVADGTQEQKGDANDFISNKVNFTTKTSSNKYFVYATQDTLSHSSEQQTSYVVGDEVSESVTSSTSGFSDNLKIHSSSESGRYSYLLRDKANGDNPDSIIEISEGTVNDENEFTKIALGQKLNNTTPFGTNSSFLSSEDLGSVIDYSTSKPTKGLLETPDPEDATQIISNSLEKTTTSEPSAKFNDVLFGIEALPPKETYAYETDSDVKEDDLKLVVTEILNTPYYEMETLKNY